MEALWQLPAAADTERLGAALSRACPWQLPGPRLLFLSGELGTGKTTLTASLLQTLGVAETVRSPTYALIELYGIEGSRAGRARRAELAVHVDLYRLRGPEELPQLGLRDYLSEETLLIIEWAERAQGELPPPDLWLHLEVAGEGRRGRGRAHTSAGQRWLEELLSRPEMPPGGYVQPESA